MVPLRAKCVCVIIVVAVGTSAGVVAAQPPTGVKLPRIVGDYVTVYRPRGDHFSGPDTSELKAGRWYDEWVPNDHAIFKGPDGRWHAFGITHPLTSTDAIHEGEFQSFHALAPKGPLKDVLRDGSWQDLPKVLPPSERPGEPLANHAPYIVAKDDLYWMIYGPSPIRLATSKDFMRWTTKGPLFVEKLGARDPSVMFWNDTYYLVFCTEDRVAVRTSKNLQDWSPTRTVLQLPDGIAPESPSLVRYNNTFYLFVCGWNGIWDRKTVQGAYQHQSYVYQSDDPLVFPQTPVTQIQSHAPEIFQGEDGQWYVSSVEWPQRGVSIARLVWEAAAQQSSIPDGYRLVWADEFEKDGRPDPEKWTYETGFVRNDELQWYQPDNAFCEDGRLIIEGRRESKPNPEFEEGSRSWRRSRKTISYTSASVVTRGLHSWQYGRFEVRAKIVAQDGLWPAIWFLGEDGRWPSCGEIDLMEFYNGQILANACWSGGQDWRVRWDTVKKPLSEFNDDAWDQRFHVWRMDWTRDYVRLYVDDLLLNTIDLTETFNVSKRGPKNPFHQPHYLLLNLAIGGTQGGDPTNTPFPTRFEVDYVRVYQR